MTGLTIVIAATAGLIAYRYAFIEPRVWGGICAAAAPPLACLPRAGLLWLQREYLWGAISLALGLWAFFGRGGFAVQELQRHLGHDRRGPRRLGLAPPRKLARPANHVLTRYYQRRLRLNRSKGGTASSSAQAFHASDWPFSLPS
jgi:hypothetical protein